MEQIDLFDGLENAHSLSNATEIDWDCVPTNQVNAASRRITAAFGNPVLDADWIEKYPHLSPGKLKFRKKLVVVQEFVLVTDDKLKASLLKKQGIVSDTNNIDPQYLINVYNHTEKVALFMREFEDFMAHFMNAVHLFTVATVYDGRLLVFAENGAPLVTAEETLEMLAEIENFINKSKVYRVHSQHAIYRTI